MVAGSARRSSSTRPCRPTIPAWRCCRSFASAAPAEGGAAAAVLPESFGPEHDHEIRLQRYDARLSTWVVRRRSAGRIRLYNPALLRRRELGRLIEREFMNTFGVDRYSTNEITGTVLVQYDPHQIRAAQIVAILDGALAASAEALLSPVDLDLPINTASVALAFAARFAFPALAPVSAAVFFVSVIPSFKSAYEVLFKEKRLGVDVLDAIVVMACLATNQVLAGTVLGLTLSISRKLVEKTEDDSKKMLLNVFGKQARFVWLIVGDVEVETPLEQVKVGDVIAIHTGEAVPVDGTVVEGMAMVDQHTLTGESAPVEKVPGDAVLASTTLLAGKVRVAVTSAGTETTSAKLAKILNDTAGYKLRTQSWGERMADKAVAPTLALGALGLATGGVQSATAIVNCDLGTGIRVAAPIGMLTSLTLAAELGILVKDGQALESLCDVDTFLFDKTGTLTRERPEVGRILTFEGHAELEILRWAAAAERRFSHPIAKAILDRAQAEALDLPQIDESQYHVGYGITVEVEGRKVRVGSARFLRHEGIVLPDEIDREMDVAHDEGNSFVLVGVDDALGGALELKAAERPEAAAVIAGLRARGARHIAIISGDHEQPTRRLAERLGMDRHFSEVLPQDKAKYVEMLQAEGRKVCFIGDGVNDSIALKKANVSISLRGASSVATDTAQVVFMEDNLVKLLQLYDVSRGLKKNLNVSWGLIIVPNVICVAGAFFGVFGVMHSMIFNQIGGMAALGNGLRPLREAARLRKAKALAAPPASLALPAPGGA
jgi:heavy metal translocating P-type ATPase